MISLYSGTPGSGKSLHIAQRIYYGLKRGRTILCNFDVNLDRIRGRKKKKMNFFYVDNSKLTTDHLINFAKDYFKDKKKIKEDEILLVIDECQILFQSRNWQKDGRDQWLIFLSQHRKYGYEIVLIAQFDGMIDRQIRCLIEYEYVHRKVSNFGTKGKIISLASFGNLFVCVKFWYPLSEKLGSEFFKAHKKYYQIYDTYNFFSEPVLDGKKDVPKKTRG